MKLTIFQVCALGLRDLCSERVTQHRSTFDTEFDPARFSNRPSVKATP